MPDKSPKKPSAKKPAAHTLKEKRQDKHDKKDKQSGKGGFAGLGS